MRRPLWFTLKWLGTLAVLAGLGVLAGSVSEAVRQERAARAAAETVDVPRRGGAGVVKLGAKLAESHGLRDEPAGTVAWRPRVTGYGRVVPNPLATAEVRAPFAGTLRAETQAPWLTPGRRFPAGQALGWLDVRVGPQERLDLQAKLDEAKLKLQGAEEIVRIHQERLDRLQKAAAEVFPTRTLGDAMVTLAEARTQAATARAAVTLWQTAINAVERRHGASAWSEPLTAPLAGVVTEVLAVPGTAVEAGAVVARVVDDRRPLVQLDLPPEVLTAGPPAQVDLAAGAGRGGPFSAAVEAGPTATAHLIGPAPQIDPASQLAPFWYEVRFAEPAAAGAWRPGRFVEAVLTAAAGPAQEAVTVPRAALLIHQGRPLVYVRIGPGRYERREVRVLGPEGDRWALAAGVTAGESVVSRQAQVLLSEEFRGEADND